MSLRRPTGPGAGSVGTAERYNAAGGIPPSFTASGGPLGIGRVGASPNALTAQPSVSAYIAEMNAGFNPFAFKPWADMPYFFAPTGAGPQARPTSGRSAMSGMGLENRQQMASSVPISSPLPQVAGYTMPDLGSLVSTGG